jgi:hypothetical protein
VGGQLITVRFVKSAEGFLERRYSRLEDDSCKVPGSRSCAVSSGVWKLTAVASSLLLSEPILNENQSSASNNAPLMYPVSGIVSISG